MPGEEEFNPWQWDRQQFDAGQSRLSVQRHGRTISFDRFGVSIDGHRIVSDDLKRAPGDRGFAVRPDGAVVYGQRVVASIATPTGPAPGEVTVYREDGTSQQPDVAPAAPQQTQQELDRDEEQEMDL
jgi:hypothetical protein